MITGKASCFWVGVLVALALNGCANIANIKPSGEAPVTEIATLDRAIVAAKTAQQCDVLAIAEQTKKVLLLKTSLYEFYQWIYEQRKGGTNYSKEIRQRLEKAISGNWKLGEEVAKLYSLSARSKTALSAEGQSFAKASFEVANLSDESNQLFLGYTIAGLEANPSFLKKTKEDYLNALLGKIDALVKEELVLAKAFVANIAAHAGNGKAAECSTVPVNPGDTGASIRVRFEGNDSDSSDNKLLEKAVLKAATEALAMRLKEVTITLDVVAMDRFGVVRSLTNVVTFIYIAYPGGGGDASLSAFVQEEGGESMPLAINTYEINARNIDALTLLVASRVVGRAHFTLLKKDIG